MAIELLTPSSPNVSRGQINAPTGKDSAQAKMGFKDYSQTLSHADDTQPNQDTAKTEHTQPHKAHGKETDKTKHAKHTENSEQSDKESDRNDHALAQNGVENSLPPLQQQLVLQGQNPNGQASQQLSQSAPAIAGIAASMPSNAQGLPSGEASGNTLSQTNINSKANSTLQGLLSQLNDQGIKPMATGQMPTTAHAMSSDTALLNKLSQLTGGNTTLSPADMLSRQAQASMGLDNNQLNNQNAALTQLIDASTTVHTAENKQPTMQWGPLPLTPSASMAQHAKELLTPLREQLRFQLDQHIQKADIRLDPPELGKVELNIRLDGDRLHIQMHAANNHVREALQSGLDRLRAELSMDHGGDIQLDVAQQQDKQQQQQHAEQQHSIKTAVAPVIHTEQGDSRVTNDTHNDLNLLA